MAERVAIRRASSNEDAKSNGPAWVPATLDGERTAMVACPSGHIACLDHTIATDGTVSPSLVCPGQECDWHVFVRLEGWPGAVIKEPEP